ncbi:hypothetical protein LCL87_07330 [Rhodococcus hoagii]|nr:hypothetical protein [Prescottella equi]
MNKTRIAVTVGIVGILVLLGGGVAGANPPGPDPLGSLPLPLADAVRAVIAPFVQALVDVYNFWSGLSG